MKKWRLRKTEWFFWDHSPGELKDSHRDSNVSTPENVFPCATRSPLGIVVPTYLPQRLPWFNLGNSECLGICLLFIYFIFIIFDCTVRHAGWTRTPGPPGKSPGIRLLRWHPGDFHVGGFMCFESNKPWQPYVNIMVIIIIDCHEVS